MKYCDENPLCHRMHHNPQHTINTMDVIGLMHHDDGIETTTTAYRNTY